MAISPPGITRWNKNLPIKINVHTWRLYLDRLPTRCNLDSRGIDLHSSRCPVCDGDIETAQHLFIDCPIASGLWRMVIKWWKLANHPQDLHSLLSWSDTNDTNPVTNPPKSLTGFDIIIEGLIICLDGLSEFTFDEGEGQVLPWRGRLAELAGIGSDLFVFCSYVWNYLVYQGDETHGVVAATTGVCKRYGCRS
ncbi:reverse transcriptase zinc-binding domain-containing protein [Artemisia annua]|uniref:Reverse transcriptase zinc-binding domain-containing protein n=1 Tax=Artemisia annua TaxID=35608 RepID=A0A2U1P664_ARTAN|nr:reverse transcriptase zinc-binding domain-containing protein [Artemisia annua]